MARLEDLRRGLLVRGILPEDPVTVVDLQWYGSTGVELTFKDAAARMDRVLLYRDAESALEIIDAEPAPCFDADASLFWLVLEARRILYSTRLIALGPERENPAEPALGPLGAHLSGVLRARGEEALAEAVAQVHPQKGAAGEEPPLYGPQSAAFLAGIIEAFGGQVDALESGAYQVRRRPDSVLEELPEHFAAAQQESAAPLEGVHAAHPLIREAARIALEHHGEVLRRGTLLVEPGGEGAGRILCCVEEAVEPMGRGEERPERRLRFVEIDARGVVRPVDEERCRDYRPLEPGEEERAAALRGAAWLQGNWSGEVLAFAVAESVPQYLEEVRQQQRRRLESLVAATAEHLPLQGNGRKKKDAGARRRLEQCAEEWFQARRWLPLPPALVASALVLPAAALEPEGEKAAPERKNGHGAGVEFEGLWRQLPLEGPPLESLPAPQEVGEEEDEGTPPPMFSLIPQLQESETARRRERGRLHLLAGSRGGRVAVDLQSEREAHIARLRALGIALPAQIALVVRNEVDGGVALWIPPGSFAMGTGAGNRDEKPVHRVEVEGFYMDIHPVTNAQFAAFVEATGHRKGQWRPLHKGTERPVVDVSWEDAAAYCRWAGKRLPTEAEWEKAARGADGRVYPWGEVFEPERACVLGSGYTEVTPVGTFAAGASPYGMLDMAGNVWEWVADWYGAGYYGRSRPHNPAGPAGGEHRVLRGGAWICHPRYLRCTQREHQPPGRRTRFIGFRCVL